MRNFLLAVCACACACVGAAPAGAGEEVKIGVMGPVTGAWASEGQDMVRVVNLLADGLNQAGGVNGRTIKIEVGDDGGDPRTAANAAQRLSAAGVVAVVGTYGSAVCEASQAIYHRRGVLQIATGSTSIRLTEKNLPLFFRTCPRDDDQGRYLAAAVQKMGHRKVAVLHDNSAYAKGLAEEVKALFEKDKIEIAFYDAITPKARDYSTVLVKMRAVNPDIVVFTGYYPEAGMLLRQKREMKWDVPMIGGDATNNTALVRQAGGPEGAEGFHFVSPPGPLDLEGDAAKAFMDQYRAKYDGATPGSVWAMMAGDAFLVIVEALKHIDGAPTAAAVGEYLRKDLKAFPGFTGSIAFDEKGDRVGDVYRLYRVDGQGNFVLAPAEAKAGETAAVPDVAARPLPEGVLREVDYDPERPLPEGAGPGESWSLYQYPAQVDADGKETAPARRVWRLIE